MLTMKGGYYWQPLFQEFAKLFPNTRVFTSEWPGFITGYEGTFEVTVLPGYKFVTVRQSATGADIGFAWAPPSVLWKLCKWRPNVIFTSAFSLWTLYGLLYKIFTRSPVVLLWDGISDTIAYRNSRFRLKIRKLMARFVDAAVCNSGEGIEYLRDVIAIPEAKLFHRAFYVPGVTMLSSGEEGQSASRADLRPVFLFVGQIIKRKGWNYLLEAARCLVEKGLDTFSVTVVGDGEQRDQLKASVCSLGLQHIVKMVGSVPYQRLGAHFEAADVFVLPTLEDTWGMVVSEAMAFGKPVLCSRYAGARELVQHGVSGFVFDPFNVNELAGHMERFIREPRLITEFGQRSREIIAPHTPEQAAKALALIVHAVRRRPRSRAGNCIAQL
jgi:glycosyltransferase involved in cell wall biosynthesis